MISLLLMKQDPSWVKA